MMHTESLLHGGTLAGRLSLCAVAALLLCGLVLASDAYQSARKRMVQEIEHTATRTAAETGRRALDRQVLAAMEKVERHRFVPQSQRRFAYQNRPLPIGYGQTISQPYIVALMTDLLQPQAGQRILEIGTGSAYQAAVLAELATEVYSIEIVEPLGRQAEALLRQLGYRNVAVKVADGYYGWPEHAPFDSIMVTAAASHVPPPLVEQLKPGGRMVIPVGPSFLTQFLMLIEKQSDGTITSRQILPVRFVPLTGGH
jgi:protein-L-isoaspartate(D-aspartate) O-methyltransferase